MVQLRGLKASWSVVKATVLMAVVAASLGLASSVQAHPAAHALAPVGGPPGQGTDAAVERGATTAAAPHVMSAIWQVSDDSCPEPGHDHDDHIGCCAGSGSCVSGPGALIVPDQGPNLPPHKTVLHGSLMPVSLGIKVIPTDPPPRAPT